MQKFLTVWPAIPATVQTQTVCTCHFDMDRR